MIGSVEFRHLIIAWLVLGFCFSVRYLFSYAAAFPLMFLVSLVAVGSGFIFHELSHRFTAKNFGCHAEFRLWWWGLMMALIFTLISGGMFIFAAPGAVYILPKATSFGWGYISRRENGLISLSGPMANVLVAAIFYLLQDFGGLLMLIGSFGFMINLWLAGFNLLPFGGLDGQKIFFWNPVLWAVFAIPVWVLVAFQWFI